MARAPSTGRGQARSPLREPHDRLSFAARRAAAPAPSPSPSSSLPRRPGLPLRLASRARGAALGALAAVLALALLAAGPAQADAGHDGAEGHVHFVGTGLGAGTGPSLPSGYAETGTNFGEIVVHWTPGPVNPPLRNEAAGWHVRYKRSSTPGTWTTVSLGANASSHKFRNLGFGYYDIRVQGWSQLSTGTSVGLTAEAKNVPTRSLEADAGADLAAAEGARVELDGTGSDGPPGTTYAWTQTGGSDEVTLAGADTATPSFDAPSRVTADTTLTFKLTLTSGTETDTDTVAVTVLPWEVTGASARGDTLSVVFDRALDERARPLGGVFTVTATKDGSSRRIRGTVTAVSGREVTAGLSEAVAADEETLTLRYDRPARGAALALKGAAGGVPLPGFSGKKVANLDAAKDTTAPYFLSGTANGTTVTLTFSEALDTTSVPNPNFIQRHTSQPGVIPQGGGGVSIMGRTVTLSDIRAYSGRNRSPIPAQTDH